MMGYGRVSAKGSSFKLCSNPKRRIVYKWQLRLAPEASELTIATEHL